VSYDLLLYEREFLRCALETGLGDWTSAPAISEASAGWLHKCIVEAGFVEQSLDPGFVAFAAAQGHRVGREFLLATGDRTAQFTLFSNSAVFSIPEAGDSSSKSVEFCQSLAQQAADGIGLGLYDPQSGKRVCRCPFAATRSNKSIDTDVLSAGFARLLSAGHLRR
jgi:hypothetical protein